MADEIKLINPEIATLAVYLAGGKNDYIDTEVIAAYADKIVPGKFRWRTNKKMISDLMVYESLKSARRIQNSRLVIGSPKSGWMLSEKGLQFVENNKHLLEGRSEEKERLTREEEKWKRNERNRLMSEIAYKKFLKTEQVAMAEIYSFFKINDYITGDARQKKLQLLNNYFSNDKDLAKAIAAFTKYIQEEANAKQQLN